ncbi:putative holin [Serpentinimonas maccroryi]|uniref:putative holin n=1 Tax=Serpentinimonas maccroryi TaxID=1458426 RepID=UPI0020339394|nr:putative holin [Serpentinimonas maccroryi]MCM2480180.1 hypothetical protein [Serpentinimonas maccroryi]
MNTPPRPIGARLHSALARLPRLSGWLLITLALMAVILFIAPHQLPVSLYKLSLVSLAGVVGYWLDRSLFPYARPDSYLRPEPDAARLHLMGLAMLRRALIVAAAMIAIGLGA